MAVAPASKGNTGLAQSFMQNKATQGAPLPTIQQPQNQFTIPELPQQPEPEPVLGSMAPQKSNLEKLFAPLVAIFTGEGERPRSYGYGLRSSDYAKIRNMVNQPAPQAPVQQPTVSQPSQAQLLARAINLRAQNR